MINFSKYKAILWDFDGVIMDSMSIRDKGFEVTLSNFPKEQVQQLLDFHRLNGGLSRYVKFRYFYEEILKEPITEEIVMSYASRFSEVMMDLLIDEKLLIKDSLKFIQKYHQQVPMHIVSGSDGRELNKICGRLDIAKYFVTIQGSPTPKKELVKNLLLDFKYEHSNVVFIGDSINDFEAANDNSLEFFGYNNFYLKSIANNYIESFSNLVAI
ncbi:HAD-IA family hydrolase [Pontibacter sp. BT731]|uniref:HAD family hydrolase n=1 Tax=Pontibacter coccineus TaxID=3063328 RepID=UPI0026E14CFC|nr:HAD-IA family hydrolase [Pontibacter sp. BT731]MDO6390236.1 HAD-IA family hydrolase [Pontibacter sp. BT731]